MIIKEILLRNIRSYANAELEFPEGKVLLSGDIGAGKSTILQAIEFALFGLMRGSLSGSSLLRSGANSGSVVLRFECDNKEYVVKRGLKRSGKNIVQTNGYIVIDNTKYELSPVELKAKVLEILGYSPSLINKYKTLLFRYTVYTPQEQMREILYMSAEERKDILRKLFQLDRYKLVVSNSEIIRRSIREKRKHLEGYSSDLEEKKKKKKEVEEQIQKLLDEKQKNERRFEELKPWLEKLELLEKELNELKSEEAALTSQKGYILEYLQENKKRKLELTASLNDLRREKEEIENELTKLGKENDLEKVKKQIETLEREYNEMREQLLRLNHLRENKNNRIEENKQLKEAITKLDDKINKLNSLISSVKSEETLAELEEKLEEYKQKRDRIIKRISEQKHIIAQSKDFLAFLENKSVCPTCKQPITTEHLRTLTLNESEKQEKAQQEINVLNEVLKNLDTNITNIEIRIKEIAQRESTIKGWKEQLSLLEAQKKENEKKLSLNLDLISALENEEKALIAADKYDFKSKKKELEELKEKLEKENRRKSLMEKHTLKEKELMRNKEEIMRVEKNTMDLEANLHKIEEKEIEIKKRKDDISKKREELMDYKEEAEKIKERITEINSYLNFNRKTLSELEKEIEKKEEALKKVEKLKWYEFFFSETLPTIAQGIESALFSRVLSQFTEVFENWFNRILQSDSIYCTIDEDFSPLIRINDYDADASQLSGGEKTSLALAYRLALNKVINDVVSTIKTKDFIILDEPTEGFSSEQLDRVREVLDSLNMRQIIIVSHETKVESFVDKIIRISKSEGISRIFSG